MPKFIIGFVVGALFAMALAVSVLHPVGKPEPTCHTFIVGVMRPEWPDDMVAIGQIQLCGENMEWSNVWGPVGSERPSDAALR